LMESTTPRANVAVVSQEARSLNAARNTGMTAARSEWVVFVDDDVEASPGWLSAMVEAARRHPNAGCLGGTVIERYERVRMRTCGREPLGWIPVREGEVETVIGANMAVRREAWEAVGGFDERLTGWGDELEMHKRLRKAGWKCIAVPAAAAYHRRVGSWPALLTYYLKSGSELAAVEYRFGDRREQVGQIAYRCLRYLLHGLVRRCDWGFMSSAVMLGKLRYRVRRSLLGVGPLRGARTH